MPSYCAPLVGMHFRPPAKDVVNLLPANTNLLLVREPDNPHDAHAIKVLLLGFNTEGDCAKQYQCIAEQITMDEFNNLKYNMDNLTDPLQLGYIANAEKTGGKFASEIAPIMDEMEAVGDAGILNCRLGFNSAGKPVVLFTIGQPSEEAAQPADQNLRRPDGYKQHENTRKDDLVKVSEL